MTTLQDVNSETIRKCLHNPIKYNYNSGITEKNRYYPLSINYRFGNDWSFPTGGEGVNNDQRTLYFGNPSSRERS
jgi:hypothetical protein